MNSAAFIVMHATNGFVSMLTRLIGRGDVAREDSAEYNAGVEYEYRDAKYEYKIPIET